MKTKVLAACTCLAMFAVAGTTSTVLAGPTKTRPVASTQPRATKNVKPQPRLQQAGQRVHALRMAKFVKVNGKIVLTTPWIDMPTNVGDTDFQSAFDCYEGDTLGVPTGFNAGGCSINPPGAPDSRWFFGTGYVQPRAFADMTLGPGFNGTDAGRLSFAWNPPAGSFQTTVAVSTYEDFGTCPTFPATPGFIDGVLLDFGPQTGGAGYFFADEVIGTGPMPLFLGLPADGSGAYEIELFMDVAGTMLQTADSTQPMLWGTGEDETPPDGRIGTQMVNEWQDDTAPFGGAYGAECYPAAFAGICPAELGAMMKFYAKPGAAACYPDCNGDLALNLADFGCFQTKFALQDPYADCNGDTVLNLADFGCFQTKFALGCP